MGIREEILEFRRMYLLSQEAFAKRCGVSPVTILRIEHGGKPSTIVEGKIRKVLNEVRN